MANSLQMALWACNHSVRCLCHPHARSRIAQQPVHQLCLPRLVTILHRVRSAVKGQYAVLLMMSILFCRMPSAVTRAALDGGPSSATIPVPEQTNDYFLSLIQSLSSKNDTTITVPSVPQNHPQKIHPAGSALQGGYCSKVLN